jgi:AI-2 transport protein TqsA
MNETAVRSRGQRIIIGLLAVIATLLLLWALRAAYVVAMPLTFAAFAAMVLHPLDRSLRARLPRGLRWLGLAASMAAFLAVFVGAVLLVWLSVSLMAGAETDYLSRLQGAWNRLSDWTAARGFDVRQNLESIGVADMVARVAGAVLAGAWAAAAFLVLLFFMVMLLLAEVCDWQDKARRASGPGRAAPLVDAVRQISARVRTYAYVRMLLSLLAAVTHGVWLWAFGVDFAFQWAVLTFMVTLIPNVGSVLSVALPALQIYLQFEPAYATLVAGGLAVVETAVSYGIEPVIAGRAMRLSPFMVMLSVLFWGWLWGVAGALLAAPIMVAVIIAFAHVPELAPLAVMLSEGDGAKRSAHA